VNQETRRCARDLRALLEKLEDLKRSRAQIVQRARFAAEADDITGRVLQEAAGVAQWAEVQPAMFEDTFEKEMGKYDKFRSALEEGESTQEELLEQLKVCCLSFLEIEEDIDALDSGTQRGTGNVEAE